MRVDTALDRYITQLHADGRSTHTVGQAHRHVRMLATWLENRRKLTDVRRVRHEHLAAFMADPATITRADGHPKLQTSLNVLRSTMRSFGAYCAAAGYASRNFGALIRRARIGPRPPRALTPNETERLVAALDAASTPTELRDRALFLTILRTGIRIGSALAARTNDLELEACALHLRQMKGGGQLSVGLDEPTQKLLREYVADLAPGPLFPSRYGRPLTRRYAALRFAGWREKAKIARHASPHSLRHTFATMLYGKTRDLLVVQRSLGHRSILSTTVYANSAGTVI